MNAKSNGRLPNAKSGGSGFKEDLLFTRPIAADEVPDAGRDYAIEANPEERAALAAFDGLAGIAKLEAVFHVTHRPHGGLNVKGQVTALITQTCVVSLDPFETAIAEDVDVDFMPAEALAKAEHEKAMSHDHVKPEDEDEDLPDPIIDGYIDLGGLAGEFLALALDPYPKKPGVQFEEILSQPQEERASPFAILRKLDKNS